MRHGLHLPIAALLATSPVAAAPDTGAFQRKCRTEVPYATCDCMVGQLLRTRNGQIALDALRLMEMPEDQRKARAVELANRYDTTMTGIRDAIRDVKPELDVAARKCV
jgi:hypothetical protein